MKQYSLLIISGLIIFSVGGFVVLYSNTDILDVKSIFIFAFIIIFGAIALLNVLKKDKEAKAGFTIEDEMSNKIKYKSGYYAFMASLYMWLFIFLFKDFFPDIETMLGGGILLSAASIYISKFVIKRNLLEK